MAMPVYQTMDSIEVTWADVLTEATTDASTQTEGPDPRNQIRLLELQVRELMERNRHLTAENRRLRQGNARVMRQITPEGVINTVGELSKQAMLINKPRDPSRLRPLVPKPGVSNLMVPNQMHSPMLLLQPEPPPAVIIMQSAEPPRPPSPKIKLVYPKEKPLRCKPNITPRVGKVKVQEIATQIDSKWNQFLPNILRRSQ